MVVEIQESMFMFFHEETNIMVLTQKAPTRKEAIIFVV